MRHTSALPDDTSAMCDATASHCACSRDLIAPHVTWLWSWSHAGVPGANDATSSCRGGRGTLAEGGGVTSGSASWCLHEGNQVGAGQAA